ncbi:hypothetical protein Lal_00033431 [Lupinus albus]|nr:hypothetical protein Lal_00033431 [Lupinus albus]
MQQMWLVRSSQSPLPYAIFITKIPEHFGVSLDGETKNFEEKRERRAFQEQGALGLILELEKRDSISRMERVVG